MLYQVKPWTSSNKSKFHIFDRCLSLCSKTTGTLRSPSPSCSPTRNPYPFYFSFAQSINHSHTHNHSLIHTITRSFTQSQVLNHSLAFLSSSLITVHVVSPENTIRKHKKRAKQKEQRTKKKYIGVLTR